MAQRNVPGILLQYGKALDTIDARIANEAHRLHFEVLLRHQKRVLLVYRAIADDHGLKTRADVDRKPSKPQTAIRQRGIEEPSNRYNLNVNHSLEELPRYGDNLTPNDDTEMTASSEPTNTTADNTDHVPVNKE